MSVYVVGELRVDDPEPFGRYRQQVPETVERYGGRFVAAGQVTDVLEGTFRPQAAVVIEFPGLEEARSWYESEDYRAIRGLRRASGPTSVVLLESAPEPA